MGVADRVRRRQAENHLLREQQAEKSPTDTPSTALVAAEKPHIARLKGIVHVLEDIIRTSDNGMYGRMAFFMSTVTDELAEELSELDEIQVRLFMFQIGEAISWIGHGDNERLPEGVRPLAEMIQPMENEIVDAEIVDADTESSSHLGTDSESR